MLCLSTRKSFGVLRWGEVWMFDCANQLFAACLWQCSGRGNCDSRCKSNIQPKFRPLAVRTAPASIALLRQRCTANGAATLVDSIARDTRGLGAGVWVAGFPSHATHCRFHVTRYHFKSSISNTIPHWQRQLPLQGRVRCNSQGTTASPQPVGCREIAVQLSRHVAKSPHQGIDLRSFAPSPYSGSALQQHLVRLPRRSPTQRKSHGGLEEMSDRIRPAVALSTLHFSLMFCTVRCSISIELTLSTWLNKVGHTFSTWHATVGWVQISHKKHASDR